MLTEVQQTAKTLLESGFSVIPVRSDGSKKPLGGWKLRQSERMPIDEVTSHFNGKTSIAIITGKVSDNLISIDVDDPSCWEPFTAMISAMHPSLSSVYCKSPRGYCIFLRCDIDIDPSQKLAMDWVTVDGPGLYDWIGRGELQAKEVNGQWVVSGARIESRGEAAYQLVAPSEGYEILHGEFTGLGKCTDLELDSLLALARTFDRRPLEARGGVVGGLGASLGKKEKQLRHIDYPGDVYNKQCDYEELLTSYGWTVYKKMTSGAVHYCRPGKTGVQKKESATLHPDGRLHVYTANAAPLEPEKQYTAYAFYTLMEHDGDFSASTKALLDMGFIVDMEESELRDILEENPSELDRAYKYSGFGENVVTQIAMDLNLPIPEGKEAGRIEVIYDMVELNRVVRECDDAMNKVKGKWGYFNFMGRLGYVDDANQFASYDVDSMEMRAEQSLYCSQWKSSKGEKAKLERVRLPIHILRKLLVFPDSKAQPITGFSSHPVFDGEKVWGLNAGLENGIVFSQGGWSIDPRPFKECYDRIVSLFCGDILFRDRKLGEALFVSMMMTAMCRLGMDGGCPGYFVTANEPGTGKSTMFEMISRTVYGKLTESVDWGSDRVERRKEIIAQLMCGIECFLFDNIEQGTAVESPILAQALTSGSFKARILGKSEMSRIDARSLFVFIGNNLNMSTELSRRLMTIELTATTENPAERRVAIPNIEKWCDQHRVEAIGCLLKMLTEGAKMEDAIKKGTGFSFWDGFVRNPILMEVGVDISTGFAVSREASEEAGGVGTIIYLLSEVFGIEQNFTTRDVFFAIADERALLTDTDKREAGEIRRGVEDQCRQLRDEMINYNGNSINSMKSLGKVISALADRVVGDLTFVRHRTKAKTPIKHWISQNKAI